MIGGMDRGDAFEQVAIFVAVASLVYWLAFMDHADGPPDDDPYPKFWKRSERREHALGHAARIDPGVSLALRVDAIRRIGVALDIPPEVLDGRVTYPLIIEDPPPKNIYGIDREGLLAWYRSLIASRVASPDEGDGARR